MEAHHLNKAFDFILDLSIDFKAIGPKGPTPYEIEVEILFSWTYIWGWRCPRGVLGHVSSIVTYAWPYEMSKLTQAQPYP